MSKRMLLAIGVFLLFLGLRFALGQDEIVGWSDFESYEDPTESIYAVMICAPVLGSIFGVLRVLSQKFARPVLQPIRLN